MLLGPVFTIELRATSRRGRYHVARVIYGLFLLYTLWAEFRSQASWFASWPGRAATIHDMSLFAQSTFLAFAWAQGVALVCLVPALVAGVIAEDDRRKVLRDLLASGLSSRAIVLGKLGARLLHAGVLVMLGLPVVCLVGLFGGLDPLDVLCTYAGTASMTLSVAALSMLISVLARGPRQAIVAAYGLVAAWLFVPLVLRPLGHFDWPLEWVEPANEWVLASHPYPTWKEMTSRNYNITWSVVNKNKNLAGFASWNAWAGRILQPFAWMIGLQAAFGLLSILLAIVLLRPLRGGAGRKARRRAMRREPVAPARTGCGDDPMLWKERYTAAGGGLSWLTSRPAVLFLGTLLGCFLFDAARPAFVEVARNGFGSPDDQQRLELNRELRGASTFLFVLGMLGVASAAAVGITGEREQDTWTSLTATLLTGPEILRAKLFGAVWGARRLTLAMLLIWAVGALAGAIHPLGVVAAMAGLAVFSWLSAALGLFVSLRARNSTRALVATIAVLILWNGYLAWMSRGPGAGSLVGMPPYLEWAALVSYRDARAIGEAGLMRAASAGLVVLTLYALAALALTLGASRAFDRLVDRPRRGPARAR
jgi:hypothetical protein